MNPAKYDTRPIEQKTVMTFVGNIRMGNNKGNEISIDIAVAKLLHYYQFDNRAKKNASDNGHH